ncbi:flagellar hook assembly protein FlgD [Roseinatronobacter sp.]
MDIAQTTTSDPRAASGASVAQSKLDADYQSFLTLLIAQVSNQNPLEPMDSSVFVSQLAQLTQVEQSIVTNRNLERIDNRLGNVEALSDVQLIGRDVSVPTDRLELRDGKAELTYSLSRDAANVRVLIKAEDGTIVRELGGQPGASRTVHRVSWNGLDFAGQPLPDGVFKIEVEAKDADGAAVAYETSATTRVEELTFRGGHSMLILRNGTEAYAGSVTSVR